MGDYNLDALGWYQFERLVQALLRAVHGASLEVWGGTADLGRDAYADRPLKFPDPETSTPGPFVFQAKFVSGANAAGAKAGPALTKAVKAECDRILTRIKNGKWESPRYYALYTNVPLTPTLRKSVAGVIGNVLPKAVIVTMGDADIAASLDDHPRIRVSY